MEPVIVSGLIVWELDCFALTPTEMAMTAWQSEQTQPLAAHLKLDMNLICKSCAALLESPLTAVWGPAAGHLRCGSRARLATPVELPYPQRRVIPAGGHLQMHVTLSVPCPGLRRL